MTATKFEFSATDSRPIRLVARLTSIVSLALLATALLRIHHIAQAGSLIHSGHLVFNFTDNIIELLSVLLPLVVLFLASYQFFICSRNFHAIVDTVGSDLVHVDFAMRSLTNGLVLFGLSLVLNFFRWSVWYDEVQRCLSALK